jgi:hypothetical protein
MNLREPTMPNEREPLTKKERQSRNILIGCLLLGGVLGGAMAMVSPDLGDDPWAAFGDSAIPVTAAVIFAAIWTIILPAVTYFWTRSVDEQEVHAYKEGAYYAFYFYMIAAPAWWILWRGGLLPEPNGVIIYYVTIIIMSAVWIKKKYF